MNIPTLRFNYSAREIKKIGDEYINTHKNNLLILKTIESPNKFLEYYLYATQKYDYIYQVIVFLKDVSIDESIRKASINFYLKIQKYFMNFHKSSEYYNLFFRMFEKIKIPKNDVNNIKKLIYRLLKPFKEMGSHLPPSKKHIFILYNKKLLEYENIFSQNIATDIHTIKYKGEELDGVNSKVLKEHMVKNKDEYIFKTTYPDQTIILQNCNNPESRKIMHNTFNNVAINNLLLLKKIVILRQKIAKLLGYNNCVEHILTPDNRIANLSKINSLIKKLTPILKKKLKKEIEDINKIFDKDEFEKRSTRKNMEQINDYDLIYYSNQYKKRFLNLDSNIIKKYFPCNYTIPKIMDIFAELYGIKFEKIKVSMDKYWFKDVDLYKMIDLKKGDLLGYLYLDLYPRDGKYTHAATFELQNTYYDINQKRVLPITAMVCNFSKDYLLFGEVTTFCHELGHAIHSLVSNVKYEVLSGISMELDFAEMPSQFSENLCFNKTFLKKISYNKETCKSLDNKTIKNIILNKEYNCGIGYLTQLLYMRYDLDIHMCPIPKITTKYLYNKWFYLMKELLPMIKSSPNIYPMCRFGHLVGGYHVGYYGYLWSNIYAYDAFSILEKNGIFNKTIGMRFRNEILEKGACGKTIKMLEKFLDRKTNNSRFFKIFNI